MWTSRPLDSERPDPFGRKPANGGGPLATESYKCPTCASNIFYQPEVKGMVCRNCGNIYDPTTLEKMGSLGWSVEQDYTGDNDISAEDRKRHEIVCSSCGAVMIADENMMSTMCAFCGSPTLITRRMTRKKSLRKSLTRKKQSQKSPSVLSQCLLEKGFHAYLMNWALTR